MDTENRALVSAIAVTSIVALVGLIGYWYVQLPLPVGEAMETYHLGDRWRLMLMSASGQAVPLGRYADHGSCDGARQAYVQQAREEGRAIPRVTCERTQVWWIRVLTWLSDRGG
jgi:hypothetical protein